jgi:TonB family protein
MKQFLTTLSLLLLLTSAVAQQTKRIYLDYSWEKTTQEYAVYYRDLTETTDATGKPLFLVKDYFLSDTLQMSGAYSDKRLTVEEGLFTYYNELGQKETEKTYEKGVLNGRHTTFYRNGRIESEKSYIDGTVEGRSVYYYKSGVLSSETVYAGGKLSGESIHYHENGKVKSKTVYANDKSEGPATEYYETGQQAADELYVDGKLEGSCRWFHPNGQVSSIEYYEKDSLLRFELFNEDGSRDTSSVSPGEGPQYPGGMPAMRKFLAEHLNYPSDAIDMGLQGKVYLTLIITPQGKIKKVTVVRGVPDCPSCDQEAVRVIKAMPAWLPGKSHNRWIDQPFNLPISFVLR